MEVDHFGDPWSAELEAFDEFSHAPLRICFYAEKADLVTGGDRAAQEADVVAAVAARIAFQSVVFPIPGSHSIVRSTGPVSSSSEKRSEQAHSA
ncbi:MAG: hypothetical protein WKH68_12890 [Candidatus Limnocylindria bacterium]